MSAQKQQIEEIYGKLVSHFESLRDCLAREREYLIEADVNGLWELMEKKQEILQAIERKGNEISNVTKAAGISDRSEKEGTMLKKRPVFKELSKKLTELKMEIRLRVKENVSFIQETLLFFDELVSIFAAGPEGVGSYENMRKPLPTTQPLIVRREV